MRSIRRCACVAMGAVGDAADRAVRPSRRPQSLSAGRAARTYLLALCGRFTQVLGNPRLPPRNRIDFAAFRKLIERIGGCRRQQSQTGAGSIRVHCHQRLRD